MKKILILLFVLSSCFSALAQYKFTLDFKTNTFNNAKVYLNVYDNQGFVPIKRDSFVVVDGRQTVQGQVRQPSNFADLSVSYEGKKVGARFVLDSGVNTVSLDTPIQITKSLTLTSDVRGHFIRERLDNLLPELAATYNETIRVNGFLKISKELDDRVRQAQLRRLSAFSNDYGGLLYLYRLTFMDDNQPKSAIENLATLSTFSEELQSSYLGQQLYSKETQLINGKNAAGVGKVVPTFKIKAIDNHEFTNSALSGQPYIIVFSATWCGPCQQQLPRLKQLYEDYTQKGLKVVYFNLDDDVSRWKAHVLKNKLNWINVSERQKFSDSKVQKSFGVYAIPTCIVVDKKGTIIYNSDQSDPDLDHIENFIKKAVGS